MPPPLSTTPLSTALLGTRTFRAQGKEHARRPLLSTALLSARPFRAQGKEHARRPHSDRPLVTGPIRDSGVGACQAPHPLITRVRQAPPLK